MTKRTVILDTETTGFSHTKGDRIIELAAIEYVNGKPTSNRIHVYLNPEGKKSNYGALKVHGIQDSFLKKQPKFKTIANQFIELITGANVVAHNSKFDVGFLNSELERCSKKTVEEYAAEIIDTLAVAKEQFPGAKNGVDALIKRFKISPEALGASREKHSALDDTLILGEIYNNLNVTQAGFELEEQESSLLFQGQTFEELKESNRLMLEENRKASNNNLVWTPTPSTGPQTREEYLEFNAKKKKPKSLIALEITSCQ